MRKLVLAVITICCCTLLVRAQKYDPGFQDGAIWLKLKPSEEKLTKKKEKLTVDDIRVLKPLKDKYKLKGVEKPFHKLRKASPLQNTYLVTFDQIHEAEKLIKELEKSGVLEYVEKVPIYTTAIDAPDDPSLSTQWHLTKINAQGAWDEHYDGSNTVIAIVDDAVLTTHPDLAPNLWVNPGETAGNGIDDDGNGYIDDINGWDFPDSDNNPDPPSTSYGHGTHVAGIASAASDNATGIASIGYSAKLMCVRAAQAPSSIGYGLYGIIYAAENGADVINLSWGGSSHSITTQSVINYALDLGCIIVAAAGNSNQEGALYPAAYSGVISVAATDANDKKASFSHYGTGITISAPGNNIYSTTVNGTATGSYGNMSGTSMASPLVAGLVALMHSYNPSMSDATMINCLTSTATNIDALNPSYAGKLGAGRINAAAAMQSVGATLTLLPTADFSAEQTTIRAGNSITFTNASNYATSWAWTFSGGTPASSTAETPTVVYNTPGTYVVSLTATNANGSDVETKTGYITVNEASVCKIMNDTESDSWSAGAYTLSTGEYAIGLNRYEHKQKAMYFDGSASTATHLTSAIVYFNHAASSNTSKVISAKVYDGTSGSPGTLLGSSDVTIGTIASNVNSGYPTQFNFVNAIELPASKKYFVSIDLSSLCYSCSPRDTLGIYSNIDGETTPSATWEQWSDDAWYNTANTWGLDISLYIFPYVTNYPPVASFTSLVSDICNGNTVSFDATASTYANSEGSLEWSFRKPNGVTESIYDDPVTQVLYNTTGTHQVTLTVTGGGCNEQRSTTISYNVSSYVTPSVTLSSSTTLPDVPVTFTATATNGGTSPVYDFKKNGVVVQTGSSDNWSSPALSDGDQVSCTLTSDQSCVTSTTANSNTITMYAPMTVLPVELLYFKGNSVNGKNLLHWATATENNTDKFIIERSDNGTRFNDIGAVKAKGESYTTTTYRFEDAARAIPSYYRLRIIDTDGSFKYAQVVYLKNNSGAGLVLWPNPVTAGQDVQLVLTGSKARQEILQVMDAFGKVVYMRAYSIKSGRVEAVIPTQNLNAGVYFITITGDTTGDVRQEKLVLVK